jgi:hypothetical protein
MIVHVAPVRVADVEHAVAVAAIAGVREADASRLVRRWEREFAPARQRGGDAWSDIRAGGGLHESAGRSARSRRRPPRDEETRQDDDRNASERAPGRGRASGRGSREHEGPSGRGPLDATLPGAARGAERSVDGADHSVAHGTARRWSALQTSWSSVFGVVFGVEQGALPCGRRVPGRAVDVRRS